MSEFVKHADCKQGCQDSAEKSGECISRCTWLDWLDPPPEETRPIFEERETDDQARADRRARARECK